MRDTIDMAREAGIDEWWDSGAEWRETFNEHLKTLVALVRADQREIDAKVVESHGTWFTTETVAAAIRARGETK
jgi:hypothetical protein